MSTRQSGTPRASGCRPSIEFDIPTILHHWFQEGLSFSISLVVHLVLLLTLAVLGVRAEKRTRMVVEVLPPEPEESAPVEFDLQEPEVPDVVEAALDSEIQPVGWESAMELPDVCLEHFKLPSPESDLLDVDALDLLLSVPEPRDGEYEPSRPMESDFLLPGLAADFTDRLNRENARTGDVQISLMWNNINDLDLHVLSPKGEKISYQHPRSLSGGVLDVDMNVFDQRPWSVRPVENVYWRVAPRGWYLVSVAHYSNNGTPDPTKYWVKVKVAGREVKTYEGSISSGQPPHVVCRFSNSVRPRSYRHRGP